MTQLDWPFFTGPPASPSSSAVERQPPDAVARAEGQQEQKQNANRQQAIDSRQQTWRRDSQLNQSQWTESRNYVADADGTQPLAHRDGNIICVN